MQHQRGKKEYLLDLDKCGGQPDFFGAYDAFERVHNGGIEFRPCKRDNFIHRKFEIHP